MVGKYTIYEDQSMLKEINCAMLRSVSGDKNRAIMGSQSEVDDKEWERELSVGNQDAQRKKRHI